MSLVKSYFLSKFTHKSLSVCGYLFNETRINTTKYYTCIHSWSRNKPLILKYRNITGPTRQNSVFQYLRSVKDRTSEWADDFGEICHSYIPSKRFQYRKLGYLWYKTLDEINVSEFFEAFDMVDTFYSRFKIMELHVWMLLYHLPKITRLDVILRLALVEAMWTDNEKRAKVVSPMNKKFKQNMKELYGKFLLTELLYDEGVAKDDMTLGGSVWCCFFNREDVDPRYIEALVSYIRYQMHHLSKFNMEELTHDENKSNIWAPFQSHINELKQKL